MKRLLILVGFFMLMLLAPAPSQAQSGTPFQPCGAAPLMPCATGWYQIPNSTIRSVIPACGPVIPCGNEGPSAIIADWGSAALDTKRNELTSMAGGGHTGYGGNGVYTFQLTANPPQWVMRVSPSSSFTLDVAVQADGKPSSKHGFDGSEYIPWLDRYFHIGDGAYNDGFFHFQVDILNPNTNTWSEPTTPGTSPNNGGSGVVPASIADTKLNLIWWDDDPNLWSYNPNTNVWTLVADDSFLCGQSPSTSTETDWIYDSKRHMIVCIGDGGLGKMALDSPFSHTNFGFPASCGGTAALGAPHPGMDYDPVLDRTVIWGGGTPNTVYFFNPDTGTCTSQTFASPPPGTFHGLFGKFRYVPNMGGFVEWDSNLQTDSALDTSVWFLRIDQPPDADFAYRCGLPGVIVCEGFDEVGGIPTTTQYTGVNSHSGMFQNGGQGTGTGTQDTVTKTSGLGSYRVDLDAASGPSDPKGSFFLLFQKSMTATDASATVFNPANPGPVYIQFRQRVNTGYLNTGPGATSYWKQMIIHPAAGSCQQMEITQVNVNTWGLPEFYSQCGQDPFNDPNGGPNCGGTCEPGTPPTNGNIYLQQGDVRYTTGYNSIFNGSGGTGGFHYPVDTWVTYTIKAKIASGGWGTATSDIEAWATLAGQDYPGHQFLNQPTHIINQGPEGYAGFNSVELTPYWTNGYGGCVLPCTTWYDEMIVSTQPIPAPSAVQAVAPQTDIYLAQVAAGANDGSTCANAHAVSFFNSAANWGTTSGQIGDGITVHLCGTISSSLTAQASIGTGLITIKLEPNASMQQPAATNFISITGKTDSYLITGQAPCGWENHAFVACTESIQNTANGSPSGFPNSIPNVHAIDFSNSTGSLTVQNLEIGNLYVHNDVNDSVNPNGAALANAVVADIMTGNVTIQDSYLHDTSWAIPLNPRQTSPNPVLTVARVEFFHNDHDIALGSICNPSCYSVVIHDVHSHDHSNWNTTANTYHHDGFHFFNSSFQASSVVMYNNLFDGLWNGNGTGPIFNQVAVQNLKAFNNIFICDSTCTDDPVALWQYGGGPGQFLANNTFIQTGLARGSGPAFTNNGDMLLNVPSKSATTTAGNESGSTVTLTFTNNPFATGECVSVSGAVPAGYNTVSCVPVATINTSQQITYTFGTTGLGAITTQPTVSSTGASGPSSFLNNIMTSGTTLVDFENQTLSANSSTAGLDFNLYANYITNGNKAFDFNGTTTNNFNTSSPNWVALSGEGTHSAFVGSANLSASGMPQAGSPAIRTGTNLTSLCSGNLTALCSDYSGTARPATGAWDIGAFFVPAGLVPAPPSVAFPNQTLLITSFPSTVVTLTNGTNAPISMTSIVISGTNASDFAIPGTGTTCPLGSGTLNANSSCTVALTFTPGALGARSANMTITSSAPTSPNIVPLSGTGVASNVITGNGKASGTGQIVVQP